MNTPNKLTVARMIMVPFFVAAMLLPQLPGNYWWALGLFAAASFTDFLDGYLARKHNLVTNFGKFMDPLADKLLVVSALLCFIDRFAMPVVVVIIIVGREFLVTSVRLVASLSGRVIAAGAGGKIKTAIQMVWICGVLFFAALGVLPAAYGSVGLALYWAGMAAMTWFSLSSCYEYLAASKDLLSDTK